MSKNIGNYVSNFTANTDGFTKPIEDATKKLGTFSGDLEGLRSKLTSFSGSVAAVGLAFTGLGTAIGAPLLAMTKHIADVADNLNDMSTRTGVSVDKLSTLKFAAEQSGATVEDLAGGLKKMSVNAAAAADGNAKSASAFKNLGISVKDTAGNLKPMDSLLLEVADKFKDMPDGAQKAADAVAIFGKGGLSLIPILDEGSAGIQKYHDQLVETGALIDGPLGRAGDAFNDSLGLLDKAIEGISVQVAQALLPPLTQLLNDVIVPGVIAVTQFVAAHQDWIVKAAELAGILLGAGGLAAAVAAVTAAVSLLLTPIGLAAAAVGALTAAFLEFPKLREVGLTVIESLVQAFATWGSAIGSIASAVGDLIHGNLSEAWDTIKNSGTKAFQDGVDAANSFDQGIRNLSNSFSIAAPVIRDTAAATTTMVASTSSGTEAVKQLSAAQIAANDKLQGQISLLASAHDRMEAYAASTNQAAADQFMLSNKIDEAAAAMNDQMTPSFKEAQAALLSLNQQQLEALHNAPEQKAAAEAQAQAQRELQQAYDQVKESAGHVFDALLSDDKLHNLMDVIKGWGLSIGRTLFQNIAAELFTPLQMGLDDLFKGLLESTGIKSFFDGLGKKIGDLVSGIFHQASTAATSAASSAASSAAGVGGSAGSIGGSAISAIGAVGSVVGAISGIIGNFQNAQMEGTLNAIEFNTRATYIEIAAMMDTHLSHIWFDLDTYLPQIRDGIAYINMAVDQSNGILANLSIGNATRTITTGGGINTGTGTTTTSSGGTNTTSSGGGSTTTLNGLPDTGITGNTGTGPGNDRDTPYRDALGQWHYFNFLLQDADGNQFTIRNLERGLTPYEAMTTFSATAVLDAYRIGTNYVPKTGLYQLHRGEAIVPEDKNRPRWNGPGGGMGQTVIIQVNDKEIARAIVPAVYDAIRNDRMQFSPA